MKYSILLLVCLTAIACYRMPEEGEVSTIPDTNNPSVIRQEGPSRMPASPNVDF